MLRQKKSRLRRLITYTPQIESEDFPVDKAPYIFLREEVNTFELNHLFENFKKDKKICLVKPFILIESVFLSYVPLGSFDDEYTTLRISIYDGRKLRDNEVRSYKGNSNISSNVELSLDYCFPAESSKYMKLIISCEQPLLIRGEMWGAVQAKFRIKHMNFPSQISADHTLGIMLFPDTGLEDLVRDPKHLNAVIGGEEMLALKIMKKQGDIVDSSRPLETTAKAITLAGTVYGGKPAGSDNEDIIDDVELKSASDRLSNWMNELPDKFTPVPKFASYTPSVESLENESIISKKSKKDEESALLKELYNDTLKIAMNPNYLSENQQDKLVEKLQQMIDTSMVKDQGKKEKKISSNSKKHKKKVSFPENIMEETKNTDDTSRIHPFQ
jgi:hypothetical protein